MPKTSSPTEADHPSDRTDLAPAPLIGMDRILTLVAFVILVGLVVFLTPVLGRRSQHGFEQQVNTLNDILVLADASHQQTQLSEFFPSSRPPEELYQWFKELGLDQVKASSVVFTQAQKQRGVARYLLGQPEQPIGLLSAAFMSAPTLSLGNRWQMMNLCRSDKGIQQLMTALHTAVQAQDAQAAYALSAAGQGMGPGRQADDWLKQLQTFGLHTEMNWTWALPELNQAMLRVHAQQGTQQLQAEILENPEQCQYLVANLQWQSDVAL